MKNNKVLAWLVAVLAVALVAVLVWQFTGSGSSYYAVSLKTGELYFGKITRVPSFGLKRVYFLQKTADAENPLSVQKFSNAFWGPEDFLKINRDEVVWIARLRVDGSLAGVFRDNPDLLSAPSSVPSAQNPSVRAEE
ncbi:MAG: hypothetical protein HYU81_02360 [Candidatus Brennerbacteria bacterium]|nr:hypothetical protein [Candidatus Brennerbacteria bacterium]